MNAEVNGAIRVAAIGLNTQFIEAARMRPVIAIRNYADIAKEQLPRVVCVGTLNIPNPNIPMKSPALAEKIKTLAVSAIFRGC